MSDTLIVSVDGLISSMRILFSYLNPIRKLVSFSGIDFISNNCLHTHFLSFCYSIQLVARLRTMAELASTSAILLRCTNTLYCDVWIDVESDFICMVSEHNRINRLVHSYILFYQVKYAATSRIFCTIVEKDENFRCLQSSASSSSCRRWWSSTDCARFSATLNRSSSRGSATRARWHTTAASLGKNR